MTTPSAPTPTTQPTPTQSVPDITLADGNRIPQIGLGVLRIDDESVTAVVESALEAGYRHIDGAAGYNNEGGVGRALESAGCTRGENRRRLWVTTKLRDSEQGYDSALKAFDRQLGLLRLDYVDMYMIHWPTPFDWRSGETWRALVRLREEGSVRTLGVCNFLPEHLRRLHDEQGVRICVWTNPARRTASQWRRIRRWPAAPI